MPTPEGLPMAHPGGIDVVYDTIGKPETFEVGVRLLRSRGTLVKSGVHAPGRWEETPLYFKELTYTGSNAFGVEAVDGVRQHGIAHYLDLAAAGRVDLGGMLTHTFRLDDWRDAFATLATQDRTSAIKVAFDNRPDRDQRQHGSQEERDPHVIERTGWPRLSRHHPARSGRALELGEQVE
jgi:threonine dehydrogenase-like Zn-dependent dehydrogenase